MRHSQLIAFHNVALYSGFSRAAEALSLSQPVISEHVRKLEQEYDVLLFTRIGKSIELTKQGKKLFLMTKRLFEVEDQIEDYMSQSGAAVEGTLRIVVDSAHHIIEPLRKFRMQYPHVFISVHTANTQNVLKELRSYRADIGVVGMSSPGRDMHAVSLKNNQIIAFAAKNWLPKADNGMKNYSLTITELAKMPIIFREKGSKTRQRIENEALKQGIKLKPAIEADDREAVREIVASGAGIGFVNQAEFGHDQRLKQILIKDVDIDMFETLIYLKQRCDVKLIRLFMKLALV